MIVTPKMRGFISTTAHPVGCQKQVEAQAAYASAHPAAQGPKRVLVLGASTGYGLAARITATFAYGADTVGVFMERPAAGKRTATAGWYNNSAFETAARNAGRTAVSINGDAFSDEVKAQTIDAISNYLPGGQVDMVVYSLAAPRRTDPKTGEVYSSVLKPIGEVFTGKTVDFHTGEVSEVSLEPATPEEAQQTIKVMGGEDWLLWMNALSEAGVLAEGVSTIALSYLGPALTHAVYRDGTIGRAKNDVEEKATMIDALLAPLGGKAFVSVNKAVVTQSSAAIPVVPLYISLLFRLMKEAGTHEGVIEQLVRTFARIYPTSKAGWEDVPTDEAGRLRLDDWEMDADIQEKVVSLWDLVTTENIEELGDLGGYRQEFYQLFGFAVDGVDYDQPVEM